MLKPGIDTMQDVDKLEETLTKIISISKTNGSETKFIWSDLTVTRNQLDELGYSYDAASGKI